MTDAEDREPKKKKKAKKAAPSFEASLAALEASVNALETGELGLTESLATYEQGVQHLKRCYEQLAAAERRVEMLRRINEDGTVETDEFDEAEMTLSEKAAARGQRRGAVGNTRAGSRRKEGGRNPTANSPPADSSEGDAVDGSPGLF